MNNGSEVVTEWRQYFIAVFMHVVFFQDEYAYWMNDATKEAQNLPAIMPIRSQWERHTVLERMPAGAFPPTVSERKPYWQNSLQQALDGLFKDLHETDVYNRTKWRDYIGKPGNEETGPTGLHIIAKPSELWPEALCAPPAGEAAPVDCVVPAQVAPPTSPAAYGTVMRSGPSASLPLVRPEASTTEGEKLVQ